MHEKEKKNTFLFWLQIFKNFAKLQMLSSVQCPVFTEHCSVSKIVKFVNTCVPKYIMSQSNGWLNDPSKILSYVQKVSP